MPKPSPLEVRQAAQLALALDRGAEGAWAAIDSEVSEAIFAVRPELAPPPRAGLLEELLDDLMEGPLAREPSQEELLEAAALAAALDTKTAPKLHNTALNETIVALAPHRAPAPTLSIDDILDSVATGPFAPVIHITGEFPATIAPPTDLKVAPERPTPRVKEPSTVLSLPKSRGAAPLPPRRTWWFPAAGVAAAAAAVLLFIGPTLNSRKAMPVLSGAQMAEPSSPASADISLRSEAPDAEVALPADAVDSKSNRIQTKKSASRAHSGRGSSDSPSVSVAGRPARSQSAAPAQAAARAPSAGAAGGGPSAVRSDVHAFAEDDDLSKASASKTDASSTGRPADTTAQSEPEPPSPPTDWDAEDKEQPPVDELESRDVEEDDPFVGTGTGTLDEAERVGAIEQADDVAPPAAASDLAAESSASGTKSTPKKRNARDAKPTGGGGSAAAAAPEERMQAPLGLIEPSLEVERPDLHAVWASAERLRQQGNYVDAAKVLIQLANRESDDNVTVDAAVRAARAWLVVGDLDSAQAALALAEQRSPTKPSLQSARTDLRRTMTAPL